MKHLLKKLSIAGAGGKGDKPKPPLLKPPVMGELQYGASHSYAETIDLLSDGPIEGIVNAHGELLNGLNMLQGIYLDNTPVAVTSKSGRKTNNLTFLEAETINSLNLELDSSEGVTYLSQFFQELAKTNDRSEGGRITALKYNGNDGVIDTMEIESAPITANMLFVRMNLNFEDKVEGDPTKGYYNYTPVDFIPQSVNDYGLYIRGFIRYRGPTQKTFPWYLNGKLQNDPVYSDNNAAYRNDALPSSEVQGENSSLIWADSEDLAASKFLFSFYPSDDRDDASQGLTSKINGVFSGNTSILNTSIQPDLKAILNLLSTNQILLKGSNVPQYDLARKALSNIGWTGADDNISGLLANHLKATSNGVVICKVNEVNSNLQGTQILNGDTLLGMQTLPYGATRRFDLIASMENNGITVTDVTCPEISSTGVLSGKMHGFLIFEFQTELQNHYSVVTPFGSRGLSQTYQIPDDVITAFEDLRSFKYSKRGSSIEASSLKYNYSNILAEIRKGEESQPPFFDFKKIFVDHPYNNELFGPFSPSQELDVQRITEGDDMLLQRNSVRQNSTGFSPKEKDEEGELYWPSEGGLPTKEGSRDNRIDKENIPRNYTSWGKNSLSNFDEEAISVVHIIYNPNVEEAFITLDVSSLKDTLMREVKDVRESTSTFHNDNRSDLSPGTSFPAVLNISVETGHINNNRNDAQGQIPHRTYTYRIVALIEGSTLIDIGNPDYKSISGRELVIELNSQENDLNYLSRPFLLPSAKAQNKSVTTPDGGQAIEAGVIDETKERNRYIKITKLSHETNSVLLDKVVSVSKVTEIINTNLAYPFSAMIGTKLDSRSFSTIPTRTFDCKLKKVKIPNNYFPTSGGIDKRYYDSKKEFDDASQKNKLIYKGDWNGLFHETLQWTDNPAWILYDLLTNVRYGMGSHIDANKINKWQLYKIGRFCDNVDDQGYFLGVEDGRGGREPRFSCNIVFDQGQKIFDAINTITALFRGRTFFSNSEINFVDDRPRRATNFFTNESVKDGLFFYSNNRRDEQFNTIEIAYKDRFNNYEPKVEVVEDEEDIKERGIFKKRIDGIGITSRAMARRAAEHQIFSKIKENQQVAFTAGLETLLCKPGDLVIIEDELKTNITNFGKVLDVNLEDETIRLSNHFSSIETTGVLTVYNPTGIDDIDDITNIANRIRGRYDSFTITGTSSNSWNRFTGDYSFASYTKGYEFAGSTVGDTRYVDYASYTGISGTIVYFETGVTGWVLGSGDAISLASGDFIAAGTGAQDLAVFNTGEIAVLNMTADAGDKRGLSPPPITFSGIDPSSFQNLSRGVTNYELSAIAPEQITEISLTGIVTDLDYGCLLSGFDRPEILPLVKLGSAAKFQINDASPFFYKVISMKEENPNEYLVAATLYDTGKFDLIDKNISIENKANTYSYQVAQTINGVTYKTLDPPAFVGDVTTGIPNVTNQTFNITGDWTVVSDVTGYGVRLTMPNGQIVDTTTTDTSISLSGLNQVGVFNVGVNALGDMGRNGDANAYYDSPYRNTGIFVLYEDSLVYSKSFLNNITIL